MANITLWNAWGQTFDYANRRRRGSCHSPMDQGDDRELVKTPVWRSVDGCAVSKCPA